LKEKNGARPLRRLITRLVENEIATSLLRGDYKAGDKILVSVSDGKIRFRKDESFSEKEKATLNP